MPTPEAAMTPRSSRLWTSIAGRPAESSGSAIIDSTIIASEYGEHAALGVELVAVEETAGTSAARGAPIPCATC